MDQKHVLLICGSGASSGFMAQSIRKAAKKRNLDIDVIARSDTELNEYLGEIDVLLLGPHLKYMEKDVRQKSAPYGISVSVIEQSIYGRLDGEKGLDLVLSLLQGQ